MTAVLTGIAVVVALAAGAAAVLLLLQVRLLRMQIATLREVLEEGGATTAPPTLPATGLGQRRVLVVEILNPIELATSQVKAAAVLGALRPQLLTKIVYEQAAKQVVRQLEVEGVLADVSVQVAD